MLKMCCHSSSFLTHTSTFLTRMSTILLTGLRLCSAQFFFWVSIFNWYSVSCSFLLKEMGDDFHSWYGQDSNLQLLLSSGAPVVALTLLLTLTM